MDLHWDVVIITAALSILWEPSVGRMFVCLHRADPVEKKTHAHISALVHCTTTRHPEVNPANVHVSSHSQCAVVKGEREGKKIIFGSRALSRESIRQPIDNGNVSHGICHFKGEGGWGVCITVAFSALHCQEGIRQTCLSTSLIVCAVLKNKKYISAGCLAPVYCRFLPFQ